MDSLMIQQSVLYSDAASEPPMAERTEGRVKTTTTQSRGAMILTSTQTLILPPILPPTQAPIQDQALVWDLPPIQAPIQDQALVWNLPPMLVPLPQPLPKTSPVLVKMLVSFEEFTEEYVTNFFGFKVKECKLDKMYQLLEIWHEFYASNIARFVFSGPLNVWGFNSVHVLDREKWNTRILEVAKTMARKFKGEPASRPIQAIYEIMQYNGMTTQKSKGPLGPRKNNDMKALLQDEYFFTHDAFEKKKKRARGW